MRKRKCKQQPSRSSKVCKHAPGKVGNRFEHQKREFGHQKGGFEHQDNPRIRARIRALAQETTCAPKKRRFAHQTDRYACFVHQNYSTVAYRPTWVGHDGQVVAVVENSRGTSKTLGRKNSQTLKPEHPRTQNTQALKYTLNRKHPQTLNKKLL